MHVLIVYATTEGHTRGVCHRLMQTLVDDGHQVAVEEVPLDEPYPDPSGYDAVFLAASLHVGRYQSSLVRFARSRHAELDRVPSAFISVSLSAAGLNPEDWEGLETCLARFELETGWKPRATHQAAGAIRYSHYDFFKRLAIQHIAAQRGQKTVRSRDYDLTDYGALTAFCRNFLAQAGGAASRRA
jgi:menaquinone-dependent protoporphyrinogen oxidase